ncbi:MAG TPA: DUF559 domain-containing protein [Dehalococcoidia bacterium]|nr:DUF559 domain-containing protein [Dehalococcoidia bacterium]
MIAEQYKHLDGFAAEIAAGELSEKMIASRSEMYILSAREAFNRAGAHARGIVSDDLPAFPGDGTSCFFWSDRVRVPTLEHGAIRLSSVKVGDNVLTHQGRYRRVLSLTSIPVEEDILAVQLEVKFFKDSVKCAVTPDHMFLTEKGWMRADSLSAGDKLGRIGLVCQCEDCDNIIALDNRNTMFCSVSCCNKTLIHTEAANERTRELVADGKDSLSRWRERVGSERVSEIRSEHAQLGLIPLSEHRRGKTYEELYGDRKASEIKRKISTCMTGRTYEERFGDSKAAELKRMRGERTRNKTYEEIYSEGDAERLRALHRRTLVEKVGNERAKEIRLRISEGQRALGATFGERYGEQAKGIRQRISESVIELWRNPQYKKKRAEAHASAMKNPATRQRLSEAAKKQWANNYDRMRQVSIENLKKVKFRDTDIELVIERILIDLGVKYDKQKWICGARPDFLLPEYGLIIEADGIYWHSLPGAKEKDEKRDRRLSDGGYDVIRFPGPEIRNNPQDVKRQIERLLFNHGGEYKLVYDAEIISLKREPMHGTVKCLVVEDDSSFVITRGLISHNCLGLTRCGCNWDFRKKGNTWECYWLINTGKVNCELCIQHASEWAPFTIEIGTKSGSFVTIEGRPVFMGGPSQGGGKASPSGDVPSDVATKEN